MLVAQAHNQLGTPGRAKRFLRGAQIFWTMSNNFELCPTHFSRGREKFCRGLRPMHLPWLRACWGGGFSDTIVPLSIPVSVTASRRLYRTVFRLPFRFLFLDLTFNFLLVQSITVTITQITVIDYDWRLRLSHVWRPMQLSALATCRSISNLFV